MPNPTPAFLDALQEIFSRTGQGPFDNQFPIAPPGPMPFGIPGEAAIPDIMLDPSISMPPNIDLPDPGLEQMGPDRTPEEIQQATEDRLRQFAGFGVPPFGKPPLAEELWDESGMQEELDEDRILREFGDREVGPSGKVRLRTEDPSVGMPPIPRTRSGDDFSPNPDAASTVVPGIPEDWIPHERYLGPDDPFKFSDEFRDAKRRNRRHTRDLMEQFDTDGDGIISERERASMTERGMADAQITEGHPGDPFKSDLEIDERFRRLNPEIDVEGEPLGPHTTRRKFGAPTGTVVRVPPQLRGRKGFTDEPIQMVSAEMAANMRKWMGELSEEDAVSAAEASDIMLGGILSGRDNVGPDEGQRGPGVRDRSALRYTKRDPEFTLPDPDADISLSDDRATPTGGSIYDARFHKIAPRTGEIVKRKDYWKQRQEAYEGGNLQLSPREIEKLGGSFGIRPADEERTKLWRSKQEERKGIKADRLATRRRLKRERYGDFRPGGVGQPGGGRGQDPYINVPRFPGESDAAYAQRYSSMASALGQAMSGGGGDYGAMLNFMAQMMGNETAGNTQKATVLTQQIAMLEQQLAIEERVRPGGKKANQLRARIRNLRDQLLSM